MTDKEALLPLSGNGQEPRDAEGGASTDDSDELSLDLPNPSATSTPAVHSGLPASVTVRRKKSRVHPRQPPQSSQAGRHRLSQPSPLGLSLAAKSSLHCPTGCSPKQGKTISGN